MVKKSFVISVRNVTLGSNVQPSGATRRCLFPLGLTVSKANRISRQYGK